MSRENVEVVRQVFDAIGDRDHRRLVELTGPEVEWRSFFAALLPKPSAFVAVFFRLAALLATGSPQAGLVVAINRAMQAMTMAGEGRERRSFLMRVPFAA